MASFSTTTNVTKVTLVPSCIPPPSASLKVGDSTEEVLMKLRELRVLRGTLVRRGVLGVVSYDHPPARG